MRILLADDEARVRFALRVLLHQQPGMDVVAEACDVPDLLAKVETTKPDLVLLDWELPGQSSPAGLEILRQRWPGLQVIVLSGRSEAHGQALAAGADAFVSKAQPPERLLEAIGQTEEVVRHDQS